MAKLPDGRCRRGFVLIPPQELSSVPTKNRFTTRTPSAALEQLEPQVGGRPLANAITRDWVIAIDCKDKSGPILSGSARGYPVQSQAGPRGSAQRSLPRSWLF